MLLHRRREFVRNAVAAAPAAALAACCLAVAACGGGSSASVASTASPAASAAAASSAGAVPAVGSTQDPLAGLTATDIGGKAFDNFKAATSMKWDGTFIEQGEAAHSDLALTFQRQQVVGGATYPGAPASCAGTIRFTSPDGKDALGSYQVLVRSSDAYMRPDAAFWSGTSGMGSGKSYSLIAGKYVHFPPQDQSGAAQQVHLLCDRQMVMAFLNAPGTITKGPVTTLDGIRVVPIKDSSGVSEATDYVTDTSKPEVVELSWHFRGDVSSDGTYTFSVGVPVTVAPQPAQVIPAASLGM